MIMYIGKLIETLGFLHRNLFFPKFNKVVLKDFTIYSHKGSLICRPSWGKVDYGVH